MILKITKENLTYYEFSNGCYCFLAFSLAELLNSLPTELKNICLTQLN